MYNVLIRPDEGFQKHYCPTCKTEYDCPASYTDMGCDDEDFERKCRNCLGIELGVDFVAHIKVKDVKIQSCMPGLPKINSVHTTISTRL
ncbi:MAG: hypothetical protein IIA82_07670 [Thaumarchaeota archaeon]|nr:hypothetical protein [Nitrososphaerota archaeon]